MNKQDYMLAVLSTAEKGSFTPVQVQKLFFLLDKKLPGKTGGPFFKFKPYDYGPFDAGIYGQLESLSHKGLVEIIQLPNFQWRKYRLTDEGLQMGREVLSKLESKVRNYISDLSQYVRHLTFAELVTYIYKEYPEMKQNSIFQS